MKVAFRCLTMLVLTGNVSAVSQAASQTTSQAASPARQVSDARAVEYIVARARASATLADFAKQAAATSPAREDMLSYLGEIGSSGARMIEIFADGTNFVLESGAGDVIEASYDSQPRPHLTLFHKVIYLDGRPTREIVQDISGAIKKQLTQTAALDWFVPRAHAEIGLGVRAAALGLAGRAAADQQIAAANSATATLSPIGNDEQEISRDMAANRYSFECKDPKDFGKPVITVKFNELKAGDYVRFYRIEPSTKTPGSYALRASSIENDINACTYRVEDGQITHKSGMTCGISRLAERQIELNAKYRAELAQAKNRKNSVAKPAALRLSEVVIPPIAIARLISCCGADSKCHEKIGVGKSAGDSGAGTGSRPVR